LLFAENCSGTQLENGVMVLWSELVIQKGVGKNSYGVLLVKPEYRRPLERLSVGR